MFIVFEGIDGCGKSSQVQRLQSYIYKTYRHIFKGIDIACEPTSRETGRFIRKVLSKDIDISNIDVITGLFLSDRALHQKDIKKSVYTSNNVYICDRYIFSNVAYNAKTQEDMDYIEGLNSVFLQPDLCFYIDTDIDTCISRINERDNKDIFESKEYLEKVKSRYDIICSSGKMIRIDGNQSKEEVFNDIKNIVDSYIESHYKR